MIIKIIIATILISVVYLLLTSNKENLKIYETTKENIKRPDNSFKKYLTACKTNCNNNNIALADIEKCYQDRCYNIKSVDDVEYFQQEKPVQYKLQNSTVPSDINGFIDKNLISGRNYNNNKNFWNNVPRKVIDKVCEPKDNEDCIITPNSFL